MSNETNVALLSRWLELWSGNLELADEIVGSNFVGHFPPTTSRSNEISGSSALTEWIQMTLALFTDVQLTLDGDPIADADKIVGRWLFRERIMVAYQGRQLLLGHRLRFTG